MVLTIETGPDEPPDPLCHHFALGPDYDQLLSLNLPFYISHRTIYFLSEHHKPPVYSTISLTRRKNSRGKVSLFQCDIKILRTRVMWRLTLYLWWFGTLSTVRP